MDKTLQETLEDILIILSSIERKQEQLDNMACSETYEHLHWLIAEKLKAENRS